MKKKNTKRAPQSSCVLIVPKYVPVETRFQMAKLLKSIVKPFRLNVEIVESLGKVGGNTKCPTCGKKFVDVSDYRALTRLSQHIRDKHPELVKAIQTPPNHEVGG
jgi:hypothetical protein